MELFYLELGVLVVLYRMYFNPRIYIGCECIFPASQSITAYFNPRTHTGCECNAIVRDPFPFHFNPRTHTGCEIVDGKWGKGTNISIHAPIQDAKSNTSLSNILF